MISPDDLKGHSGANLSIIPQRKQTIVRKAAHSVSGNARLLLQMEKQQSFNELKGPIKAPEIFDSGTDDEGRFYFDMEFIPGLDGHRFLEKCTPTELRSFTGKLSDHLLTIKDLPRICKPSSYHSLYEASVFKLIDIHLKKVGLSNDLVGSILDSLERIRNLKINTQSFCHGDFTLENIMVNTKGDLIFLDFLDSTFEHPFQDLAKLSQDIHGGWFRIKGRRISSAFIIYLDDMLAVTSKSIFPDYNSIRNILLTLNFCRILPYVSSGSQKKFVIDQIHKFSI